MKYDIQFKHRIRYRSQIKKLKRNNNIVLFLMSLCLGLFIYLFFTKIIDTFLKVDAFGVLVIIMSVLIIVSLFVLISITYSIQEIYNNM